MEEWGEGISFYSNIKEFELNLKLNIIFILRGCSSCSASGSFKMLLGSRTEEIKDPKSQICRLQETKTEKSNPKHSMC